MNRFFLLIVLAVFALNPAPAQTATQFPASIADFDALPPCDFDAPGGLMVGAVVYNWETGDGCTQNLDTVFQIASVPKVFVSGAYHQAVAQNIVSPAQTVRYDENYHMGGRDDCLTFRDIGRDVTLRELDNIMITCSDNAATWMMMDVLGWYTVSAYIANLGIEDISPVVPYVEVDRLKLIALDSEWADVPPAMASRYWRGRDAEGLGEYLRPIPRYTREDIRRANQAYFNGYDYNRATPRAIAQYMAQLREDYRQPINAVRWDTANGVLGNMLNTQRQYSTQAFPGSVLVGAKNGYDSGVVAELNFTVSDIANYNRQPETIAVIFTQHPALQMARGAINDYLIDLSPQISAVLFGEANAAQMVTDWTINTVRFGTPNQIDDCWYPYRDSNFAAGMVADFELCIGRISQDVVFENETDVALGLVLRGMGFLDTRLTFIYTAPDGTTRSYQTRAPAQNDAGFNWYHPVDGRGTWTLDIFVNLRLAYSGTFEVR